LDNTYHLHSILDVTIEKIVPRGFGLAFAEGLTVFVALAVAGDKLRVRVDQIKGKTAFAEIVEVLDPSPNRIKPPCRYFGECGGCDFQQMTYTEQLNAKLAMIRDCLHRIAKVEFEGEIRVIPSPAEFGYRSRAQWHLEPETRRIGYYKRNSRDLVDIESCPILAPELNEELKRLHGELPWEKIWENRGQIDAAHGDRGEVSTYSLSLENAAKEIDFTAAGETFHYSADVFFQGNQTLIPDLLEIALGGAEGETALDLYSGVGLFSLPMARKFKNVIGVEDNAASVKFAKRNAYLAGLSNIDFKTESVRKYLYNTDLTKLDFALLDPPRAGTEKETIQNLIKIGPPQVSYVACEPSILARDLKRFDESGYRIDSITAIDLFPQTHHVETVARLSKH
jgi:23S rRNA (uracil1939-C5)-methyltransferase